MANFKPINLLKQIWHHKWVTVVWGFLRKYGVGTVLAIVVIYLAGRWLYSQDETGFGATKTEPAKTLWDWLELLIVPGALGVGALWFNHRTAKRDKEREEATRERDRAREDAARQDEILQDYLDDMSQLLMDEGLKAALVKRNKAKKPASDEGSEKESQPEEDRELPVVDVARARTVSTLRRLKGTLRHKELLDFLRDASLYQGKTALLRGAKMDLINLEISSLREFDLQDSILVGASLVGSNLSGANLRGASLQSADLAGAKLCGADLTGAHLQNANLAEANLEKANLMDAEGVERAIYDRETRLPDGSYWHEGVDWTQWTKPKKDDKQG